MFKLAESDTLAGEGPLAEYILAVAEIFAA